MIEALFGTKYLPYIAGAYGVVAVTLLVLVVTTVATGRRRRRALARLEEAGLRRAARRDTERG